MPEEIGGELAGLLLLAVFGGDGLELLHQRVAGLVAGNGQCAIIDQLNVRCSVVIGPGADILIDIGSHRVEAGFEQHAILEIRFRAGRLGVVETDAATAIRLIVEFGIALDLLDTIDRNRLGQPIIEGLPAFTMCRPVGIGAGFTSIAFGGSIRISISSEKRLMMRYPFESEVPPFNSNAISNCWRPYRQCMIQ